ncbi:MAG: hypothetical protein HXY43_06315 [Fischerella sp.]|uniref:hypothetical protein n=1 Tax=Fischerella sp. TaxID=1191 RepID=UPI001850746D|nr:hypothetical protein [Fischerella sp.]NWF58918.1 hypothetical protein [Fischerella sp.]
MVESISQSQMGSAPEKKTQVNTTHKTDRIDIDRQPSREVYSIAYALPGQVGFCIPRISRDERYLGRVVALLKAETGVTSVQVNSTAASVAVSYKSGLMSDFEMRSHLIDLIQSAAVQLATIQPTNSYSEAQSANSTGAKQRAKVVYSITYALPGQVGFCIPRISRDEKYLERLVALLKAEAGVNNVQINITAASVVVIYKSGILSDVEMRSHLMNLIQSGIDLPATSQSSNSFPINNQTKNTKEQDKEKLATLPMSSRSQVKGHSHAIARSAEHASTDFHKSGKQGTEVAPSRKGDRLGKFFNLRKQPVEEHSHASVLPVSPSDQKSSAPPAKTDEQAKQPAKVAYSVAHAIPGRVRFRVPRIAEDPKYVQRLEALLKADPTVIEQRVNPCAASIAITYKSAVKPNTQKRDRSVVEAAAVTHLASLLESANDVAVA